MLIKFEIDTSQEKPEVVESIMAALALIEFGGGCESIPSPFKTETVILETGDNRTDGPVASDALVSAITEVKVRELDPSLKRIILFSYLQMKVLTTKQAMFAVFDFIKAGQIKSIGPASKNGGTYRISFLDSAANFRVAAIPNKWETPDGSCIKQSTSHCNLMIAQWVENEGVIGFNQLLTRTHHNQVCSIGSPRVDNNTGRE